MIFDKEISTNNLPAWLLFPALIVAGLLNYYPLPFFSGELILGNVVAIVVLFFYGLLPALVISLVAGIAAYLNWGYAFNIAPFLAEILVLHWAIKTERNPINFGILYWATAGWIIAGLGIFLSSDFVLLAKALITVKYIINGLLSVFIGYVIARYLMTKTRPGTVVIRQKIADLLTNQLFYIVTFVSIALSFFWLKAIERERANAYQQLMQMNANHISIELDQHIASHQQALIISALANTNVTEPTELQHTLQHLKETYPTILTLLSTDENGEITATAPQNLLQKISLSGNVSVADRNYFRQVKESGVAFISDVFEGRGFGRDPIIALSVPLTNDVGFAGIIEASLDLSLLERFDSKAIAPEESLMILDQNNHVIYASDQLGYEFLQDLSGLALVKHLTAPDDYFVQDEIGNDLIVQSAPVEKLGWTVVTTVPRTLYNATIGLFAAIALVLLGLLIIVSFYLARWAARVVIRPIDDLSKALDKAERAEDLLNLDLTNNNRELVEIDNVQKKLHEFAIRSKRLISDLKQANINQDNANDQLHDINENLEQIVATQTNELNSALAAANKAGDAHEKAKQEAELATRSKAEFLATMSHEIRTPMNGVLGMAHLLTETSLNRVQKDYVDTILSSGNLLLTIIDDVLDYSKLEAGKVELELVPLNLEHLLHDVLEVMVQSLTKNIELVLDYPPTIPTVFIGDPSRLRQIIYNLVGNAIKFTEQGLVVVLARYEGQTLTLEVKDTGVGITEEQQQNLFNSFSQADNSTTRKYGGTGLGLAICKDLTELMGGEITIQSEYGTGTSFTVSLNLAAEIKPESKKIFNKINILLVESNQDIFRIYAEFLHYYGANVTQCSESKTLIDRLLDADAAESGVDLILISGKLATDQELKIGIAVRNHPKLNSIPIVLLRQSSNKADLESYYSAGFTAFFTKPIRHELLIVGLQASIENTDPKALITKHSLLEPSRSDSSEIQFSGHILLVEDVLTNQIVAKTMLDNMGLTVDVAEDGLQAITQWEKGGYDLIFMDCRMPNMDGYEATRRIRSQEQNGRTPIIALTANATEDDRKKCHAAGMDAMVTKPFKPSDLQAVLTEWIVTNKSDASSSVASPAASLAKTKSVSVAVLDIDMFKKTQELMGDAFPRLVDSVFNDTDKILEKLSNWTDLRDSEGLALLPHSLKSSSAYIGATKLNHLAHECENDARDGKVEKALLLVKEMQQAYADAVAELAKLGFSKPI